MYTHAHILTHSLTHALIHLLTRSHTHAHTHSHGAHTHTHSLAHPRYWHACALNMYNDVTCWGASWSTGDNSTGHNFGQANVPFARGAKQIAAGGMHTCAILQNGSVVCWCVCVRVCQVRVFVCVCACVRGHVGGCACVAYVRTFVRVCVGVGACVPVSDNPHVCV